MKKYLELWVAVLAAGTVGAETVSVNAEIGKTNVDYCVRTGDTALSVNAAATAGVVRLNPLNTHTGGTTLNGGTLDVRSVADAGTGALTLAGGIFKFAGTAGATWTTPITNAAANGSAVVWQTDEDLVVDGPVDSPSGAFIKTGAGTLTLKSHFTLAGGTAVPDAIRKSTVKTDLSTSGAPTKGYSNATFLEGTTILDPPEGDVAAAAVTNLLASVSGVYTQIGGWTTDDGEEKSAIVEQRGGVTATPSHLHIGMNNGKSGQTGTQPYSGLRVTGGRFLVGLTGANSVYMGYSNAGTQKSHCFLDISSANRLLCDGFYSCHSAGSVCDVYVHDGGYLYALGGDYTTGSSTSSAASTNNLTVTGAGSWISLENFVNDKKNGGLTTNIRLADGAVMEMRNFTNTSKGKLNLVVDGGVWRHRNHNSTLPHWPSSMTSVKVGSGGLIVYHNGGIELNPVVWDKGVEPVDDSGTDGGVSFTQGGTTPQLLIRAANTYCGPTVIEKIRVELGGAGRLPETTALVIRSNNGGLLVSNGVQTVASLQFGYTNTASACSPLLAFAKGSRLNVTGAVRAGYLSAPKLWLFENAGPTNKTENALVSKGVYTVVTAPLAAKVELARMATAFTFPLKPDTVDYTAYVAENGDQAELRVEVTDAGTAAADGTMLVVPTTAGTTSTPSSESIAAARIIFTNPALSGGGTVDLGALTGFAAGGHLETGSGRTTVSDLSFLTSADGLVLGQGTFAYTGTSATLPGLTVASLPASAVLDIVNASTTLTITNYVAWNGALSKMGAGTLHLGGSDTITLSGNVADNGNYNGMAVNGDGPTTGFRGFNANEGVVTIGTVDDPSDAPTVVAPFDFSVGSQSHRDGSTVQTAGEFVMNNGSLTMPQYLYLGYYNGADDVCTNKTYPRMVQNGGYVSSKILRLYQDGNAVKTSRACPQFYLHGGTNEVSTDVVVGYQACPADFDGRATFVVDGGLLKVANNFIAGNANGTLGADVVITGGCVEVGGNFFPNSANATETNAFLLAHGGILACAEDFDGKNMPSTNRFDGGIYQPLELDTKGNGHIWNLPTAFLGKGGLTFDLSRANSIAYYFVVQQAFTRDPALAEDETDGGLRFTGDGSAVLWKTFENSFFNGGILVDNGARLIIGTNCVPADVQITVKPGAHVSDSSFNGASCTLGSLALGESGATEATYLEVVGPGLTVNGTLNILSPVAIATRATNQNLVVACTPGVYTALVYAASNADVDLAKFVLPANFPNRTLAVEQFVLESGDKAIVATIGQTGADWSASDGTMWIGSNGGTWSDTTKWQTGAVPANSAATKIVFTNATKKTVASVTLDAPVVAGALEFNAQYGNYGYTLSGESVTLGAAGSRAEIVNVKGTNILAVATTAAADATRIRGNKGSELRFTGDGLAGSGDVTLNDNVRTTEGRIVAHVDPSFAGTVTTGGGTVEMDDLSFVRAADQLTLGLGTFRYTGTNTTVAGLRLSAGSAAAAVFESAADVTVDSLAVSGTSAFLKLGTGTLRVHGTSAFKPNVNVSNSSGNTMQANGDCPLKGLRGLGVATGTMVWGEPDDPDNAPSLVVANNEVTIGAATSTSNATFVLNNGAVSTTGTFYLGYYGKSLTPRATYAFQMNGGTLSAKYVMCAYNWVNKQNMNTEVEVNGGRAYVSADVWLARGPATDPTTQFCKWTQNGGVFGVKGSFYPTYWNTNQSPRALIDLNGGTLAVSNSIIFVRKGSNTENNEVRFRLNAGGRLEANVITQQVASTTTCFYGNGGTFAPNGVTAAGAVFGAVGHLYASTNGLVVDTSILAGKSKTYTIGLPIEHDPDAPAIDGGVTKQGAGLLTLSGASTFTGPLTMAGGMLHLEGSAPAAVSGLVFAGGTLDTVAGLAAGTVTGAGLCQGSLAVASALRPEVDGVVNVTGDFTLAATAKIDLTRYAAGSLAYGDVVPLAVVQGTASVPQTIAVTPESVAVHNNGLAYRLKLSVGADHVLYGSIASSGTVLLFR